MTKQPENKANIAGEFEDKVKSGFPEYVFVYAHTGSETEVRFEDVTIKTPLEGKTLIENLNFTLKDGERAGLTGPNGGGKSSIFRTMAELTSTGHGRIHITIPEGKQVFISSQEMRKPPTTLPGLLRYPIDDPDAYTHEEYEQAMDDADLSKFKEHLPWNAVEPDVLFPRFQEAFEYEVMKHLSNVDAGSMDSIGRAVVKALGKKIHVPDTLEEYFTEEKEEALRAKMVSYVKERFIALKNKEGGRSLVFPGFKGRAMARGTINSGANNVQDWLRHGSNLKMSGGEEQKLAFARMFLQVDRAGLFLLDEVTSALKAETADELSVKLIEKAKGVSVIGIIHNPDLLKHYTHHLEMGTDKRIVMHDLVGGGDNPHPQP